jgi:hypothetical protein
MCVNDQVNAAALEDRSQALRGSFAECR